MGNIYPGLPEPVRLSADTPEAIYGYDVSPDDSRVVYEAGEVGSFAYNLYSNSILGGSRVMINDPPSGDGTVGILFVITPNSLGVIYVQSQTRASGYDLYCAFTNGAGSPINLTAFNGYGVFLPMVKK